MAGPPLEGFDRAEQRGQVQASDKTPDRTHAMIVRHEFLQADGTPLNPRWASIRGSKFDALLVGEAWDQ
jgi:hypothetical protein